jgi:hypothetical protein
MMKPHRLWIKSSANSQKVEFKIFQKISILAHSARNFMKVKTSKIFPSQTLPPCQISKESVNHKVFNRHFKKKIWFWMKFFEMSLFELLWWEIDPWSLQQKWCLWVLVLLWPIKWLTFLGFWELKKTAS